MARWWDHNQMHLPELDEDTRNWVADMTGCIPIYLPALFRFKGKEFDKDKFLQCPELAQVETKIILFYKKLFVSCPPGVQDE